MRAFVLTVLVLSLSGCFGPPTPSQEAQNRAMNNANNRSPYVMVNDVEFKNYDKRQQMADDPTTILWCTSSFPIPSSPLFTVPIVGKLTSGNKRPFPTQVNKTSEYTYYPELSGPDGMFGSSGEYRYGFTPGSIYSDWYMMPTFCTNEPMVWQRQKTDIIMASDVGLLEAHTRAREALKNGHPEQADQILREAIKK